MFAVIKSNLGGHCVELNSEEIGQGRNYRLHPLIHTFPFGNSAQDVEMKKAEPKTPHLPSLNQDIVVYSQEQECELKYDMSSQNQKSIELVSASNCSCWRK